MVQVYLLAKDKQVIEEIAIKLLQDKFTLNANIDWDRNRYITENGAIVKAKVHLLSFITKGLLFQEINSYINHAYPQVTFEMYSTAIVNVDANLSSKIMEQTKKV
jgi:hypothetical protein